jgi:large subunit ribosomal protein L21
MTYAILKHGGHQYRVSAGDHLLVDRLAADIGAKVTLEPVLFVANGETAGVGTDAVADARVIATVVAHRRGRKLRVFTYKPKKRHRRTLGYRSQLTELRIDEIAQGGAKPGRAAAAKRTAARERTPEPEPAAVAEEAAPTASEPSVSEETTPAAPAKRTRATGAKRATPKRASQGGDGT